MKRLVALVAFASFLHPVHAGQDHGAHVHGAAALTVVVEGAAVVIGLESPAVNVVGFEHLPANDEQRAALADAIAALGRGEELFTPSPAARCRQVGVEVHTPLAADTGGEGHDHEQSSAHSDFEATWEFACESAENLSRIEVRLFDRFAALVDIDAAVVGPRGQTALELDRDARFIDL